MFERPRVFADPFGSFLSGFRQAEQDQIAFEDARDRRRANQLDAETQSFQNALDRNFAADQRALENETRDISNQALAFQLGQDQQFVPSERLAGLNSTLTQNRARSQQNALDAEFGRTDRILDQERVGAINDGRTIANGLETRFGAQRAQADIAANAGLARDRFTRRPGGNNGFGPAGQARLDSINGGRTGSSQAATGLNSLSPGRTGSVSRNDILSPLDRPLNAAEVLERSLSSGQRLNGTQTQNIIDQFEAAAAIDPAFAQQTLDRFPNLSRLIGSTRGDF